MHLAALIVPVALIGGACSAASDTATSPSSTSIANTASAGIPAATTTGAPAPTASEPEVVTTNGPTTLVETIETSTYAQLEELHAAGSELDSALAEFAAILGPLPDVPSFEFDGSVHPSLTHVLTTIDEQRDELTDEQAAAVDAALAAIFDESTLITEFAIDDGTGSTIDEPQGFGPVGFGRHIRSAEAAGPDDAPEAFQDAVRQAANAVTGQLGGAPLNIWVQIFPAGAFGDVAARNSGLGLDDPERDDHPGRPDCVMKIAGGATAGDLAGIVAHEVVHCWQFTRLGYDVARYNAMGVWAMEGMAAYFGQAIGGVNRFNANWWGGYVTTRIDANGQWNLYESSYDAIGFWSRIAEGADVVSAMRRTIDASPGDVAMFNAATSDLAGISWLGAGTFQRSDWSGGWTASGPGMPATPRTVRSHTVIERNDIALSADRAAQSNHEIAISPIDGIDGTVLTAAGAGSGVLRVDENDVVLPGGSYTERWCIGVCECPDGTPAFSPDRTIVGEVDAAASLVGGSNEATTLRVGVNEFDPESELCDEEEDEPEDPTPTDVDAPSLIGTWRANPESVARMFEQASAFGNEAAAFDVLGTNGDVFLEFADGGIGSLTYDTTLLLDDSAVGDLTLTGGGSFNWTIGGGALVITETTFSISVSSSALGGELLTITDADVPNSGTTRLSGAVSDNMLTITSADGSAGQVFFPVAWIRQ